MTTLGIQRNYLKNLGPQRLASKFYNSIQLTSNLLIVTAALGA